MTFVDPGSFADAVLALSLAHPGQDVVFMPQPPCSTAVCFPALPTAQAGAVLAEVELIAARAIRFRDRMAAAREQQTAAGAGKGLSA